MTGGIASQHTEERFTQRSVTSAPAGATWPPRRVFLLLQVEERARERGSLGVGGRRAMGPSARCLLCAVAALALSSVLVPLTASWPLPV